MPNLKKVCEKLTKCYKSDNNLESLSKCAKDEKVTESMIRMRKHNESMTRKYAN